MIRTLPFVMVLLAVVQPASAVTLYDASLGTLPGSQHWLAVVDSDTVESYTGMYASLDTTAVRADQSGYFSEDPFTGTIVSHPDMPTLDRASGYTIGFAVQVLAEAHNARDDNGDGRDDRAGFSVIAISEDLRGLELGFFADRVWAYAAAGEGADSLFTQAEGVDFDATADVVDYQLSVLGDGYALLADGALVLAGNLRNYNPSGVSTLTDPYNNPSFLFLGDDTTSAESHVLLGDVTVELFAAALPGDANGDRAIDGLDYLIWAEAFGDDPAADPPGAPENGDFNGDTRVDGLDYLVWASNFGRGPNNATAVPEPTAAILLLLGLLTCTLRGRRHR
ncbi:MAG: PEP-CTERM sorting domain-containing protein [Planctomycetales bacterium]|nr:PEP-CTERM sorting domain-containing protein [Planctomycetales bacterium]